MRGLVLAIFLTPLGLLGETISLYEVPQMHCPLCTSAVKKSLKKLEGVHKIQVRLNTKQARIRHDDALTDTMLQKAIGTTGYKGILVSREKSPL